MKYYGDTAKAIISKVKFSKGYPLNRRRDDPTPDEEYNCFLFATAHCTDYPETHYWAAIPLPDQLKATDQMQRDNFQIIDDGARVFWPDLNFFLTAQHIVEVMNARDHYHSAVLTQTDRDFMDQMIANPPAPTEALIALFAKHRDFPKGD